jgi:hypothetical protein
MWLLLQDCGINVLLLVLLSLEATPSSIVRPVIRLAGRAGLELVIRDDT